MTISELRPYGEADLEQCLEVFDSNVPRFFSTEERDEFADFLDDLPGPYFVAPAEDGRVVACGGYARRAGEAIADLCWGMVHSELHGRGLGRALTQRRIEAASADPEVSEIRLHTSQHTVGFYRRLGFELVSVVSDAYAPGLDRCDMRLVCAGAE